MARVKYAVVPSGLSTDQLFSLRGRSLIFASRSLYRRNLLGLYLTRGEVYLGWDNSLAFNNWRESVPTSKIPAFFLENALQIQDKVNSSENGRAVFIRDYSFFSGIPLDRSITGGGYDDLLWE